MALVKAKLLNVSVNPPTAIDVLFNPSDYGIDRGAQYAELQVPGLQTPILQFVRGQAEMLALELLVDRTDGRTPVEDDLSALRAFICITGELHSPPVCRFEWGAIAFQGVVTSLKERLQLFDETGKVLRARVTLSLKSYESAEVQLRRIRRSSPDRTRVRVMREGESLAQLAYEAYGDPRLWSAIADANGIERPRFVPAGTVLRSPAL